MKLVFTLGLFIISLMVGCRGPMNSSRGIKDPFEKTKVRLGEFKQIQSTQELAVLVDENCINENKGRSQSFLTAQLMIRVPNGVQTHKVKLSNDMSVRQIKAAAKRDDCVKGVSFNQIATADSLEDPMIRNQSHLVSMGVQESERVFFDYKSGIHHDVVVAVVDTGIDLNHPDLKDNLWVNTQEANGVADVDDDKNGFVDDIYGYNFGSNTGNPQHENPNDHGTHVAGLAAAVSGNGIGGAGVMGKNLKIMALNVFGRSWNTDTAYIDRAIRYAADNGANVINISIGGFGTSDTTASAMAYAINKGVTVVVAAGNSAENIDNPDKFYFPASYAAHMPGLISVGATDARTGEVCDFSNTGVKSVKIFAPGCDKETPKNGLFSTRGNSEFGYKKGTSQSSPLVAAAAALTYGMLSERNQRMPRPSEIENVLLESTKAASIQKVGTQNPSFPLSLITLSKQFEGK